MFYHLEQIVATDIVIIKKKFSFLSWTKEDFADALINKYYILWKIQRNNTLICMVVFSNIDEFIDIMILAVDKNFQKQGYATFILENIISFAEKNHIKTLLLEVRENNKIAIKLYKKFNFKINRIRKNYYYEEYKFFDALEMKLELF